MRIHVRRGVTRTVFIVGRWAIKVPALRRKGCPPLWNLARGISANMSERQWGNDPCVAPVLWSLGGIVNIYPRVQPAFDATKDDISAIGFLGPQDPNPSNVGWLNGRLVWTDYDGSWNDCHRNCCEDRSWPPLEDG